MNYTLIDAGSKMTKQPKHIKIPLKNHQRAMVYNCHNLEKSSFGENTLKSKIGIIGDSVGSGKTLSVLALISNQKILKITEFPDILFSNSLFFCENPSPQHKPGFVPTNIIVVPHTIINQWEESIQRFTNFSYIKIYNKKSFESFVNTLNNDDTYKTIYDLDIILVSSTKYNDMCDLNNKYWNKENYFSRVVFDEADTLKIPRSREISASFIWFVTSSFNSLINPYSFLHYINPETGETSDTYITNYHNVYSGGISHSGFIRYTMTGIKELPKNITKNIVFKNDDNFIRDSFKLEEFRHHLIKCESPFIANILHNSISKTIMGFINAGDIEGAISHFGCGKTEEKNLIFMATEDLRIKLKNLSIKYDMHSKMEYSESDKKEEVLSKINEKIEQLNSKIESIKNKLDSNTQCCICYDDLENTTVMPCCNTKFCFSCISMWNDINKKCPFCRTVIIPKSLIIVVDKESEKSEKSETPVIKDKPIHLMEIIENKILVKDKPKILIFSEFGNSFDNITGILDKFELRYSRVSGSSVSVSNIIRRFKSDSEDRIDVLLLNAKKCASGINLENTTDIVFLHAMNGDITKQIIGRGQRPGRTSILDVWTLVYKNEI